MLLAFCACYWHSAHVTGILLMLLVFCSCYWHSAHVTGILFMLLAFWSRYWHSANVTGILLMSLAQIVYILLLYLTPITSIHLKLLSFALVTKTLHHVIGSFYLTQNKIVKSAGIFVPYWYFLSIYQVGRLTILFNK
jgi:hypothetical protein